MLAETRDWINYDLPEHLQGKSWGGKYRGQKQKWVAVRFTGPDSEINLTPEPGHKVEFEAWRVGADRARSPTCVVPFKRDVYEAVVKRICRLAPSNLNQIRHTVTAGTARCAVTSYNRY